MNRFSTLKNSNISQTEKFAVGPWLFVSGTCSALRAPHERKPNSLSSICEIARTENLYRILAHSHTLALIDNIPEQDSDLQMKKVRRNNTELPSPINPPSDFMFHTRCPNALLRLG